MVERNEQVDFAPAEDASADLYTAAVMVDVTERALNGVRSWFDVMGQDHRKIGEIMQVDVMLFEIKDKIEAAKAKIDQMVDTEMAARRAAYEKAA